jgi:hypothetical protein
LTTISFGLWDFNKLDEHSKMNRHRLLQQRRMPPFPCRVEGWLNICGESPKNLHMVRLICMTSFVVLINYDMLTIV